MESKPVIIVHMFKNIPFNVVILGVVSFFNDTASEMIYPIVPIFLTSVLGAPVEVVGFIEGMAEGLASLFKFIFGYISDRIGKRKVFVVSGYSFASVSKLLIGLAYSWPYVLFARIIDRLGKGLRTSPRDAILLQNATPHNKGFIFGFHRAMDSAGAVVGPLIALFLLAIFKENMRTIFLIAFIPAFVGVLLLLFLVKEKRVSKNEHKKFQIHLRWKDINISLKLFFLISILFALGNSSDALLILRAQNLGFSITLTVLTYVLYNVSQTVFATPAGSLADKIGARKVYAGGLIVFSLVYFAFAIIHNPLWLWIIFPFYGIYIAATDGVSKAYIAEFITEKEAGSYFGLYQTGISVAAFLASFIAGLLWTNFGAPFAFYYGSFMSLLAFVILLFSKASKKL